MYVKEAATLTGNQLASDNDLSVMDIQDTLGSVVQKERILVVDDNPDMRDYIQKLLHTAYDVRVAENGKIALDRLEKFTPDVIVSDIMMPVMDGIELLKEVKSTVKTSKIPFILLSARAGEEARIEGYDTGADDYLIKPFAAKELVARVKAQIKIAATRRNAELQLTNAFNQAPVATSILMGPKFEVLQANALMLELWGKTAEQMMHKPIIEGLPEIAGQGFIELLTSVLNTGERFVSKEHSVELARNGILENHIVSFVYEPLYDIDGTISGIIVVANDVTEIANARKIAETNADEFEKIVEERTLALKVSNAQLSKTNHELEQFAYVSSHDLQEPLRKIQTFTELVSNHINDGQVALKYLDKIDKSASRMSTLIKDVLSYSKLSDSNENTSVDLNLILNNVLEDYELLISQKKATMNVQTLPTIKGIERQIHQLFSNLISNSLKFSERPPVISISSKPAAASESHLYHFDPAKDYVNIEFKDNGIGFDPNFSDKIFTLFQRLNNRSHYEGTGIGLALCKKIVDNHGGIIEVRSKPGEGSIFNVLLPV